MALGACYLDGYWVDVNDKAKKPQDRMDTSRHITQRPKTLRRHRFDQHDEGLSADYDWPSLMAQSA